MSMLQLSKEDVDNFGHHYTNFRNKYKHCTACGSLNRFDIGGVYWLVEGVGRL